MPSLSLYMVQMGHTKAIAILSSGTTGAPKALAKPIYGTTGAYKGLSYDTTGASQDPIYP